MSGEVLKADRDFTKEVDSLIPEAESLAAQGQTQNAIDKLLGLEKQTRQASDLPSTSRVIIKIVTICKESGDWSLLNEQVLVLSKKHSQLKQAITKMVQAVMGFLDDVPDMERKLSVIETLRTVTEGKVRYTKSVFGERWHTDGYATDLCGGRAGTSNPHPYTYQERPGRHHCGKGHLV